MADKEVQEDLQEAPEESEGKQEDESPSEETTQESVKEEETQEESGEPDPTVALSDEEFLEFLEGKKKDVNTRTTDADAVGRGSESGGTTGVSKPDRDRNPDGTFRGREKDLEHKPVFRNKRKLKVNLELKNHRKDKPLNLVSHRKAK